MITFDSISDLANSLRAAATAHHEFEKGLGHTDTNWQEWYAAKMALDQSEPFFTRESDSNKSGRYVSCHTESIGAALVACIRHLSESLASNNHPSNMPEVAMFPTHRHMVNGFPQVTK